MINYFLNRFQLAKDSLEFLTECKGVIAIIWTSWIAFLGYLLGGFDLLIKNLIILMLIDYISGLICGFRENKLNSNKAYKGLRKKIMVWLIIICATIFSRILQQPMLRDIVAIFYCATEILSIIENAGKLGVPIPNKLKKALEQCRGK